MRFGLKELLYIVGALVSLAGLYGAVLTSDARQTAQIESLQRSREENRQAILEQGRQIAEMAAEMKTLRVLLAEHDAHEKEEAHRIDEMRKR
jgi:urease accessory protein UreF